MSRYRCAHCARLTAGRKGKGGVTVSRRHQGPGDKPCLGEDLPAHPVPVSQGTLTRDEPYPARFTYVRPATRARWVVQTGIMFTYYDDLEATELRAQRCRGERTDWPVMQRQGGLPVTQPSLFGDERLEHLHNQRLWVLAQVGADVD